MIDTLAFVMRRASRHWPVLVTLGLGVVLATTLLASAPLFNNTVIEFGLRRTLLDAEPLAGNLRLAVHQKLNTAGYRALHDAVQEMIYARMGAYVEQVVPTGSTQWAFPWQEEELLADRRVRIQFYDRTFGSGESGMHTHGDLVVGYWPGSDPGETYVVDAVIGQSMAEAYRLQVGDRLPLSLHEDETAPLLWIQVAGILRPHDLRDRYWFAPFNPLRSLHSAHYQNQFAALVSPERFFAVVAGLPADSQIDVAWNIFLDPASITIEDIPHLRAALVAIDAEAGELAQGMWMDSDLDATLSTFAVRAQTIRVPILFLTATILLLALYYVTMDAALALRQFQLEFAVLRSRGASAWQLFRIQLVEAGLLGLVALLSGPGLALSLVRLQTVWGPLADMYQPEWSLWLPLASWAAAIVGVVASLVGLLLPMPTALRQSVITYQQSLARAEQASGDASTRSYSAGVHPSGAGMRLGWQRFYVDVFALLAGLILIWRIRVYGSIVGSSASRPQVDWLLLLAPLALLLGSAAILLRIFPLLLNMAARLVSRGRGLILPLALWRAARDPTHVARLVLLLTLAMALGLFSTGLSTALDRNEADQSRYTVGGDLRLLEPAYGSEELLRDVPGVAGAAAAWRGEGTIAVQTIDSYPAFAVLAVETGAFSTAAAYRSDFAAQPMPELLSRLAVDRPAAPIPPNLPEGVDHLGIWLWLPEESSSLPERLLIEAKLQTAEGMLLGLRMRSLEAGQRPAPAPDADGASWHYFEGRIPGRNGPWALHSLWLKSTLSSRNANVPWLRLGSFIGSDSSAGDELPLTDLEHLAWQLKGIESTLSTDSPDLKGRGAWAEIAFTADNGMRSGVWYGLYLADAASAEPLPALISPAFGQATQVKIGDRVGAWVESEPIEFEVAGVVDYFPTLYDEAEAGFLITDLDLLIAHLNRTTSKVFQANEVLVALAPGASTEAVTAAVPNVEIEEAEAVRKAIKADPLALGLRSVTSFGYVLTTVLSLAGFGTHFYLGTRQHSKTYAVLRALGMSPAQLYATLLFEQLLLILSGLALGTVLGLLLNRLTLPGLPLSLGGRPPVPPFLTQTDWTAVGGLYLTLLVAFLVSLGLATWLLWRSKLHSMLRVDEE